MLLTWSSHHCPFFLQDLTFSVFLCLAFFFLTIVLKKYVVSYMVVFCSKSIFQKYFFYLKILILWEVVFIYFLWVGSDGLSDFFAQKTIYSSQSSSRKLVSTYMCITHIDFILVTTIKMNIRLLGNQ